MFSEPQLSELTQLLLSDGAYENALQEWTDHCKRHPSDICDAMNIDILNDFKPHDRKLAFAIARKALLDRQAIAYRNLKPIICRDAPINHGLFTIFEKMAQNYKKRVDIGHHPSAVQAFNDYVNESEPRDSHTSTQAGHNDDDHAREQAIQLAKHLMDENFKEILSNYHVLNADVILALTSRDIYNMEQFLDLGLFVLRKIHQKRDQAMSTQQDWMHRHKLMTLADEKILMSVLHTCGMVDSAGDAEAGSRSTGKKPRLHAEIQKARLGQLLLRLNANMSAPLTGDSTKKVDVNIIGGPDACSSVRFPVLDRDVREFLHHYCKEKVSRSSDAVLPLTSAHTT